MSDIALVGMLLLGSMSQLKVADELEYERRFKAAELASKQLMSITVVDAPDQKLIEQERLKILGELQAGNPVAFLPTVVTVGNGAQQSIVIDWFNEENVRTLIDEREVPARLQDSKQLASAIMTARGLRADGTLATPDEQLAAADQLYAEAFRSFSDRDVTAKSAAGSGWPISLYELATKAQAHAHYDQLKLMPATRLMQITALARRTVAIHVDDGVNGPVACGSGVLFSRRNAGRTTFYVATAAHVLANPRAFNGGVLRWANFQPARVSVRLVDDQGGYANAALAISFSSVSDSLIFKGDGDFVVARLDVPDALMARVSEITASPMEESSVVDDCQSGMVFGFSALRDSRTELTWIPPGRIVFPAWVKPSEFGAEPSPELIWWVRALVAQLTSKGLRTVNETDLRQVVNEVRRAYCVPVAGDPRWMLCGPVGHTDLSALMQADGLPGNLKIHCFGTDLVSEPGCSGGPVYQLGANGPRLIGIVSGRTGGEGNDMQPRSVDNYARIVPWAFICGRLP